MIKLIEPYTGKEENEAVAKVLESGWLTTGEKVYELEDLISSRTGHKHAVCVSSCTNGLHVLLEALACDTGSTVAIPANCFVALPHIIEQAGYKLIIRNSDRYLDIPVHIGGNILEADDDLFDLTLMEDMAHMYPHPAKKHGVYSFHANKLITTGEGGCIVTNDDSVAEYCRQHIYFGQIKLKNDYDIISHGYKYNMSDIQAAIGIEQHKKLDEILEKRWAIVKKYRDHLSGIIECPGNNYKVPYLFQIKLPPLHITRGQFRWALAENGIETGIHFKPLYHMSYFKVKYNLLKSDFPDCEDEYLNTVSIPLHPNLRGEEVSFIIENIKTMVERYGINSK